MYSIFHSLLLVIAGATQKELARQVKYLKVENETLRAKLPARITITPKERQRLLKFGKNLGSKAINAVVGIVAPETFLRWIREDKKASKLATENPTWGFDSLVGRLANLGHEISANTVKNILKQHGIEPARDRSKQPRWKEFLAAHWNAIAATDFFSVEVWTKCGLVTYFVLFVIDIATRRVKIAGITNSPNGPWMKQVAKQLTDPYDDFLLGKKYLVMDRDGKFAPEFQTVLKEAGIEPVLLPPKSPNLNASAN